MKYITIFTLMISALCALDILPKQVSMHPNTKLQFSIFHEEKGAIFTPNNLVWQVSGGYVSMDGSYTAPHQTGKYIIKVSYNNFSAESIVYVKSPNENYITKLEIADYKEKIYAGKTISLKGVAYDQNNNVIDFRPVWLARGKGEISEDGKLKAISSGQVEVMLKDANSPVFATAVFTIYASNIDRIEVSPKKVTLNFGQKMRFFAIGYDSNGNEVFFEPNWIVSGHGGIQKNGEYTAGSYIGSSKITATDPVSGKKGYAEVNISQTNVAHQGNIEIGAVIQHNNVLKIAYQVFGDNIHRTSLFAVQKDDTTVLLGSATCSNGTNITFEKQYTYDTVGFEIQIYDNYNRLQGSVRRNFSNQ